MITLTTGNLLKANAEALVNTVNCVGVMGKGIALQFKKAFPDNFAAYRVACQQKQVTPGKMFVHLSGDIPDHVTIINFPTKRHWRNPSRMEDIEAGLTALIEEVKNRGIKSIAIPPLGCGLGGLEWSEVRLKIEAAFAELPDVTVLLYQPQGAPAANEQPIATPKPAMTRAQALLILLMRQYRQFDYQLTLLEIHKLAYLLQEQGEDLKLRYQTHHYGPYARNIRFLLQKMEGHFISGIADDEQPNRDIELLPGAVEEAEEFIGNDLEAAERLRSVSEMIEGFETPYGMELLSTIHWLKKYDRVGSVDDVMTHLQNWSRRKAGLFKQSHVEVTFARLSH